MLTFSLFNLKDLCLVQDLAELLSFDASLYNVPLLVLSDDCYLELVRVWSGSVH